MKTKKEKDFIYMKIIDLLLEEKDEELELGRRESLSEEVYILLRELNEISRETSELEVMWLKMAQMRKGHMENPPMLTPHRRLYNIADLISKFTVAPTPEVLSLLKSYLVGFIERDEKIPTLLARFSVEQLDSDNPFTIRKRGRPRDFFLYVERFFYCDLVRAACSLGYPLRDSAERKGAFTAVADRYDISPEQVEMHWTEYHRQLKKTVKAYEKLLATLPENEVQGIRVGEQELEEGLATTEGMLALSFYTS